VTARLSLRGEAEAIQRAAIRGETARVSVRGGAGLRDEAWWKYLINRIALMPISYVKNICAAVLTVDRQSMSRGMVVS
jgi:hypothetical protein